MESSFKLLLSKFLLVIVILSSCVSQIKTQHNWFENNNTWIYEYITPGSPPIIGYEEIKVVGETEINGQLCKILNKKIFINDSTNSQIILDENVEYVFEAEGKIYHFINGEFILIYDFTLEVGDTFKVKTEQAIGTDLFYKVDSISEFQINGHPLIVQHVTTWDTLSQDQFNYQFSLKEKIGFNYFFPSQMYFLAIQDVDYKNFKCYEDDFFKYENPFNSTECKYLPITNNSTQVNSTQTINIYPNPFHESFRIRIQKSNFVKGIIYDSNGNLCETISETNQMIGSNLLNGNTYYLKIKCANGNYFVRQVIKL